MVDQVLTDIVDEEEVGGVLIVASVGVIIYSDFNGVVGEAVVLDRDVDQEVVQLCCSTKSVIFVQPGCGPQDIRHPR